MLQSDLTAWRMEPSRTRPSTNGSIPMPSARKCGNAALPELCHYGNSGKGILEGPGFKNVDMSLFKNFGITERVKLQFRSEFFNIFNTPQFNVPNSALSTQGGFLPQRASNGTSRSHASRNFGGVGAITRL